MSRADVKAALRLLEQSPAFRQYVYTLQSELDDIMVRIVLPENRHLRDELCAEARVYRSLLQDININTTRK